MHHQPAFLIIGAMRAGTTALYADLCHHPKLYGAPGKEVDVLIERDWGARTCREAYGSIFKDARDDQLCFEASTGYAKRPLFEGVPEWAREVIGPAVKVIYLVRDPIRRAISHHHYHIHDPRIAADFDTAVATWSELTDFGRYAMQLEPWLETFGHEQVLVVRFEDYIADQRATLTRVHRFLGLDERAATAASASPGRRNASTEAYVPTGVWRWLAKRPWFRQRLRHRLPEPVVDWVRRRCFAPPPPRPAAPAPATLDALIERFEPEIERLASMIDAPAPLWDLRQTRAELMHADENADQALAGAARV